MCGLTGLLAARHQPQAELQTLVHRGPDAEGVWTEGGIALGHRRLSILDLSPAGAQPMPVGRWLRGPLRDWRENLLSRDSLTSDGLFNASAIRQTWAEHLSGRRDWSVRLWAVLMFQAWQAAEKRA